MKRRRLFVLPAMRCDRGCGECCGVTSVTARERRAIEAYVRDHAIKPVSQGATCPFYQRGTCAIYPVRPRICQAFGHTWKMECPRGYNENVDDAEVRRWLLADGPPVISLHAAFGIRTPVEVFERAASLPFVWQRQVRP